MKFSYKFSNLCGTVYRQGNIVYTPDGLSLLSPVGNRVTLFDLANNKAITLPFETRKNICRMIISPNGHLLITADEDGHALLVNLLRRVVLHHFNFKAPVVDMAFSPDGRYFAVTHGKLAQVWLSPGTGVEFAPFELHRTYAGLYDDAISVSWSPCSKFFLVGSRDLSAHLYSLDPVDDFKRVTLSGHRDRLVAAFFGETRRDIYTISRDAALFVWRNNTAATLPIDAVGTIGGLDTDGDDGEAKYECRLVNKHFFKQNHAKVVCVDLHVATNVLVVGFSDGVFGLYEMPSFNMIHSLSVSQRKIDTISINASGEWLALGCSRLGQLLVWEWKSETYVLKQQGHSYDMSCLAYSPDGQLVVTGGDEGKVKVWNTTSGFCFVTFTEHSSAVRSVCFSPNGQAVFSASLDGTVRAFDLVRYRNFRTFTSPAPAQFGTLTLDPSGDILCAGCLDTFEIYVWSVKTGRLVEILAGHTAPVSALAFSPTQPIMVSASWDKTVKVWDVFENKSPVETLNHSSDCLAVTYRPDGREICVATLDGQLAFWDIHNAEQTGTIEGRRDIAGGRKATDKVTARNSGSGKCFRSICYSADGACVLAGGQSKYVCIYEARQRLLIKRFQLSQNRSLDGVLEKLNSKRMTESGVSLDVIDDDEASDLEDRLDHSMPGQRSGDPSVRKTPPEVRASCVGFSPTDRAWAAATTEGLMVYSLDDTFIFDPFELDMDVTPAAVRRALRRGDTLRAAATALRLGEADIVRTALESVPVADVSVVARDLPLPYVVKLLKFIVSQLEMDVSPHVHFYLTWSLAALNDHGRQLKGRSTEYMALFQALQKVMTRQRDEIGRICEDNSYSLRFLTSIPTANEESAASKRLRISNEKDDLKNDTANVDEETEPFDENDQAFFDDPEA